MITDAKSFLFLIGGVTNEKVLDEGVQALDGVVKDWAAQIVAKTSGDTPTAIAGIYQGALLGIQIAARGRAIAAKQLAQDLNIQLEQEDN